MFRWEPEGCYRCTKSMASESALLVLNAGTFVDITPHSRGLQTRMRWRWLSPVTRKAKVAGFTWVIKRCHQWTVGIQTTLRQINVPYLCFLLSRCKIQIFERNVWYYGSSESLFKLVQLALNSYPDNSPPGQFPTVQVLGLINGLLLCSGPGGGCPSGKLS